MRSVRIATCCLLAIAALGSCESTSNAWRLVDPELGIITVVGRLELLDMPAVGDVRVEVTPDVDHGFVLAPGQQRLECVVRIDDRDDLESQLLNLTVGHTVSVSGVWIAKGEGSGTRRSLDPTTDLWSID